MQVGFSILVRGERVEFQFHGRTLEDPRSLVRHASHDRRHALLMGRLTYRDELVDQLRPTIGPDRAINDAAIALAAYRQWGAVGLARLEGSFALAIWDGDEDRLLGCRDALGGYPLFWTRQKGVMALGTCMEPLIQLATGRSPSMDYLAEFLTLPAASISDPSTPHCAYEGVTRISAGSTLEVRLWDGLIREHKTWDWLDRMIDPGTDKLEELGDLVGEGLRRAIGEQLRGRVASHVSGGMDSTAVALLARDQLRAAPGSPPVHAISMLFEKIGMARETPFVESALSEPGLVPHRVSGDDLLDYDGFIDPPWHDEPFGMLTRFGLMGKMIDAAADLGADTLLTGSGAELVTDQRPFHLADLIGQGRLRDAWRGASDWGRSYSKSAWSYLWKYGLLPWTPTTWQHRRGIAELPGWIRPEFVRSFGLRDRVVRRLKPACRSANLSTILMTLDASRGDTLSWYAAAPRGLTYAHPFKDSRFLRLGLGIQARFRQEPGTQKPLLARAMRDVLPRSILDRRIKGHYNSLIHFGLARNLPVLESIIQDAAPGDMWAFDKELMLRSLREAALGHSPGRTLEKLDLGLCWLRWRSLHDETQRPSSPAAVVSVARFERLAAVLV